MKQGSDMSKEAVFCNKTDKHFASISEQNNVLSSAEKQPNPLFSGVIWDKDLLTVDWACAGLKIPPNALRVFLALAIFWEGKLIGTLLFHDGYASKDVWWTIYTTDKHWCQRRFLRLFFKVAFDDLKCRRIGILVQEDNKASLKLVRRLGFQEEGRLRCIGENGEDCIVFSLLRGEMNGKLILYDV